MPLVLLSSSLLRRGQIPAFLPSRGQISIRPRATKTKPAPVSRQDMEKRAAKERVAALKHDTDKLLKLSVELKESVDKSNENVLSIDVIKRAEEIEKLAHSVKEKMKGPN